jgi:hypothetical protein
MTATRYSLWILSCGYPGCLTEYTGDLSRPLNDVRRNAKISGWSRYREGLAWYERCPAHPRADDPSKAAQR